MDRFLQAFRATTEKYIADLDQLLQESILAFRRSFGNADSEIYTGMDKIATTLSQLQRHFEKAAVNQDENDTKERARKIRNKIHIFWSDSLSKRKALFWKRLDNQKGAELYEFYMQKRFVPKKFRTKLPRHCTEREIELHGNSAMDRVKNEIIILNPIHTGLFWLV